MGELELKEAFEWANAEGGEAVAELVESDEQPGGGGCDGGHLFLAEADEERKHRGQPRPEKGSGINY